MVDLAGQFYLGVHEEVAPELGDGDVQKAAVAQTNGKHDGERVKGKAAVHLVDSGCIHLCGLWE